MQHKRDHRVAVYLNIEEAEHLDHAVTVSGLPRADYIRQVLLGVSSSISEAHLKALEDALQDTRQSKDRLEQLLMQSQTTVSNLTLALPAAGETSRRWWKVW